MLTEIVRFREPRLGYQSKPSTCLGWWNWKKWSFPL